MGQSRIIPKKSMFCETPAIHKIPRSKSGSVQPSTIINVCLCLLKNPSFVFGFIVSLSIHAPSKKLPEFPPGLFLAHTHRSALQVFFRFRVEGFLASRCTEIIGLTFIFCLILCSILIYLHSTNRVYLHIYHLLTVFIIFNIVSKTASDAIIPKPAIYFGLVGFVGGVSPSAYKYVYDACRSPPYPNLSP